MNVGDVVETLAGLPVGTWVERSEHGRKICLVDNEPDMAYLAHGPGPVVAEFVSTHRMGGFARVAPDPFTICRPPVGAVLPSARYAPGGTWLRDCDGDICHASSDPSATAPTGAEVSPWILTPDNATENDRYAPFTVIADPREGGDSAATVTVGALAPVGFGNVDDFRRAASAAMRWMADTVTRLTAATVPDAGVEGGSSPVARMLANTRRTPSGWMCVPSGAHVHATGRGPMVTYDPGAMRNDSTRSTVSDSVGTIAEQVGWHRREPEPMPRVDLITTGGDQSWRKARPVNRRPGRVEPVCGWSAYYD